ncbi:hypothetical protein [Bradyrhizobium diazoefficiens]|uniref:Uncharacterized protein n=1 Tax=Bradyrhizobium diazoefficiens TaxID=1355477 RepID=A0A810BS22_9BRAD|nr:hypothetical protein [Bradyrhizobium diazoefficiens]WLC15666.1 hypothetical protein QIH76_37020 [Bradyrhizobium diazoefficiens]BCA07787.1 hypothetical protein H12S4_86910 [Bradyrhizobium diazoefficiens]BCA25140.1 hypothetical protein BDHH15_83550 [Bradyrhizobium diazoefficiens]BCE43288.1 hypothetical protein XF3B_83190 [Bradyrhizobium diazoefficiens]BCE78210.1 hypothetical protein XF8B_83210 [Bradyrhizobium diazoefficiens]
MLTFLFEDPALTGGVFCFLWTKFHMTSNRSTDARAEKSAASGGPSEAMRALVRALARADAIEDYQRRNGNVKGYGVESSNLRPV